MPLQHQEVDQKVDQDFINVYKENLRKLGLDEQYIKDLEQGYFRNKVSSKGSVTSLVFYTKILATAENRNFQADDFGISSPGGTGGWGDLYILDNYIYNYTTKCDYVATGVYLTIIFKDDTNRVLGHGQYGGLGTVVGAGSGKGRWI